MSASQQDSPDPSPEAKVLFSTRIRPSVQQRIRIAADLEGVKIQDFIEGLCDAAIPSLEVLVATHTRAACPAKNTTARDLNHQQGSNR